MKKQKGFSMMEVLIVVAIISILLMIAVPSTGAIATYQIRNSINNKQVVLLSAIDSWKKDNFDNTKKPANINLAQNDQNLTVLDYIKDDSFYENTNIIRTYDSRTLSYKYDIKDMSYLNSKPDADKNKQVFISLENNKLMLSNIKADNMLESEL